MPLAADWRAEATIVAAFDDATLQSDNSINTVGARKKPACHYRVTQRKNLLQFQTWLHVTFGRNIRSKRAKSLTLYDTTLHANFLLLRQLNLCKVAGFLASRPNYIVLFCFCG